MDKSNQDQATIAGYAGIHSPLSGGVLLQLIWASVLSATLWLAAGWAAGWFA